jgi:copper chaperone CopZ
MKCQGCVSAIREALEAIGEKGAVVDLESRTVTLPAGGASLEDVKKALAQAGYPAKD